MNTFHGTFSKFVIFFETFNDFSYFKKFGEIPIKFHQNLEEIYSL